MPRYMVERDFPDGLHIPIDEDGAQACAGVIERNAMSGVSWVHSYVSVDKRKTYCIYDAPDPGAIRLGASHNNLPIQRITEVRVLDPYFYR
ncbi:MAG TPA: DUF4242 domain-containing protein [Rhodanobacter sp.]|nr:DUF4242 domain-containing protein [Rhodanobacter sp.]